VTTTRAEKVRAGRPGARWAFMEGLDVGTDGDPYLDRLRLVQTPWFGIYLHHIHRPDVDPDPHDHPWWFASLVIAGGYRELVWLDKRERGGRATTVLARDRSRWSLRSLGRGGAHMITDVTGPLWTLVLTGPRRGDWGFWTPAGFVGWREYIAGTEAKS
jgi:hypothetical protein